jgi:chemotaxis signal transduction protein
MSLRGHHHSMNILVETARFLVVRLGSSYLALPAAGVRGILTKEDTGDRETVTTAGIIYQPVDLALRLSVTADLSGPETRTILYSNGHSQSAIRVEQVMGLADVERKDCSPLPAQFRRDERQWFMGIMLYQDWLVLILNPLWVLGESPGNVSTPVARAEQRIGEASTAVGGLLC